MEIDSFILNMICFRMANLWKAVENDWKSTENGRRETRIEHFLTGQRLLDWGCLQVVVKVFLIFDIYKSEIWKLFWHSEKRNWKLLNLELKIECLGSMLLSVKHDWIFKQFVNEEPSLMSRPPLKQCFKTWGLKKYFPSSLEEINFCKTLFYFELLCRIRLINFEYRCAASIAPHFNQFSFKRGRRIL